MLFGQANLSVELAGLLMAVDHFFQSGKILIDYRFEPTLELQDPSLIEGGRQGEGEEIAGDLGPLAELCDTAGVARLLQENPREAS